MYAERISAMENAPTKQEHKETLGIDKLMANLTLLQEETQKLKRDKVEGLIRQMINEIPFAYQIIPNTLTESILADAPLKSTDLKLNEVVANLGLSLFDAQQRDELISIVQTYLTQRKITEKQYAAALLPEILHDDDLNVFPEKARAEVKNIAHTILEKVINEKQLRKIPGYRLESLIALVEPIIYHRLFNFELDRLRITHHLAFRKLVNRVAQDGYEKINDDAKLAITQKEKTAAFNQFAVSIANKAVVFPPLENEYEKLRFLQKDKIAKSIEMKKILDEFFKAKHDKSVDGMLSHHLKIRLTDKLRRMIHHVELDSAIYENEFTLKQAHDTIFKDIKDDFYAIKYLITKTKSIRESFHKKFFHIFAKSKELTEIDNILLDALLGKPVSKVDLFTGERVAIRDQGYPKKDIKQIYAFAMSNILVISDKITGVFSKQLKDEITRAIAELQKVEAKIGGSAAEEIMAEATSEPIIEKTMEATQAEAPAPTEEKAAPKPLVIEEEKPQPVVEQESTVRIEEEKKEEKTTPPSLQITEEETQQQEEAVPPKSSTPPVEEEPIQPAPLQIKEEPEPTVNQETIQPKPLLIPDTEEEVHLEKVAPKPLIISEEEAESASASIEEHQAAPEMHDQATQEVLDSGAMIMKNYQLGEFEKPIYAAWKHMTTNAAENSTDTHAGVLNFSSDNDVRLYVICDLAQQISAINAAQLTDQQKEILQDIKNQVLNALKDPLSESNWDYFEGTQRDIIDGKLNSL